MLISFPTDYFKVSLCTDCAKILKVTMRFALFFLVLSIQNGFVFTVIHADKKKCISNCLVLAVGIKIIWYRRAKWPLYYLPLVLNVFNSYELPHLYWAIFPSGFANPRNSRWFSGKGIRETSEMVDSEWPYLFAFCKHLVSL